MKVIVKFQAKWMFANEWLEAFKDEFREQLPNRKIWLTVEYKPSEDYIIKINGSKGKIEVDLNMYSKASINSIFEKGYLKAVIEHEIKHLQPNVKFLHDVIPAPEIILDSEGANAYEELTQSMGLKFEDFLTDIYANSGMTISGLKKYLEFEVYKIKSAWDSGNRGTIRTMPMLFVSYVEVCYDAIRERIPEELTIIANCLHDDDSNVAIYNQMKETYLTMWNAVKSGKILVDLTKETYILNERLRRQRKPIL